MMHPVLIIPEGDDGRNGVFAFIGCPHQAHKMRAFDAGFAYSSCTVYWPVDEEYASRQINKRTPEQQKFLDKFLSDFAIAQHE